MKKVYFIARLALIIVMITAVSCSSTPEDQGDSVPETPAYDVSPPPESVEEFPLEEPVIEDIAEDIDDIEDIDAIADGIEADDGEEFDLDETILAEGVLPEEDESLDEEDFPSEDDFLAEQPVSDEPESLAVVVPEPDPPPVAVTPATPAPAPPTVTARPAVPPAAAPPPATARPPAATPAPPPPAEEPPTVVRRPPPDEQNQPLPEEPPAVSRDTREIPELSNPTPAIRRADEEMVFSRVVRATVGQLVVVPFRGTGWIYLGEARAQRGIPYDSRRLDPEGQSFIFRTEAAGDYALKFQRQDYVRDFILNDYVQVIISDPPETTGAGWFNPPIDRGRVVAEPRWPSSLEEAQALRADTQPSRPAPTAPAPASTAPATPAPVPVRPPAQTPPASPPAQTPPVQTPPVQAPPVQMPPEQAPPVQVPELDPDEYLQKAKEEFDAGRVAEAIALLNRYREFYPVESDEMLWLYGQFYEANSPSRNILSALDCYRRLTREYPQSSRFDAARRRIAYLERYYINIQ